MQDDAEDGEDGTGVENLWKKLKNYIIYLDKKIFLYGDEYSSFIM